MTRARACIFAVALACLLAVLAACAPSSQESEQGSPGLPSGLLATTEQARAEAEAASEASASDADDAATGGDSAAEVEAGAAPEADGEIGEAEVTGAEGRQAAGAVAENGGAVPLSEVASRDGTAKSAAGQEGESARDAGVSGRESSRGVPEASRPKASSSSSQAERGDTERDAERQPASPPASEASSETEPTRTVSARTVEVTFDSANAAAVNPKFPSTLGTFTLEVSEGMTVYDALVATGVEFTMKGATYIDSIGGIAEKQGSATSGWMYSVDGTFPSKSALKYELHGGERIRWAYTVNLGDV